MPSTPEPGEPLEAKEVDRLEASIRELIRHENDLVNQRIGWLLQTQALLFAALAFAWEKAPPLSYILATVGISTAASIWCAIGLYHPAVERLKRHWNDNVAPSHQKNRVIIGMPDPPEKLVVLMLPWTALPLIFIGVWLCVLNIT